MSELRFPPIHILVKDLSFMMFYFVIMKYNLTNETYLPETISDFSEASDMGFWNMISASLFYNIIPMIVSLILYLPIVYGLKKLIAKRNLRLILTGFVLTTTTPILYLILSNWRHNDYYQTKAEFIAWTLCFITSILFYYFVNKKAKNLEPIKNNIINL